MPKCYKDVYIICYKQKMKLQRFKNGSYFISLPRAMVNAKLWQVGDTLNLELDLKGNYLLKKAKDKEETKNVNAAVQ